MNKAVFFDRDGVINEDYGYVGSIEQFEFIDGVFSALNELKKQGFLLILVTNQSGIARGMYTESDFCRVTSYMQQVLRLHGCGFNGVYYCPHHPEAQIPAYRVDCDCRKPKPGMYKRAISDFNISPADSYAVGDHARDLIGAAEAGVKNCILVGKDSEIEKINVINVTYYSDLASFVCAEIKKNCIE